MKPGPKRTRSSLCPSCGKEREKYKNAYCDSCGESHIYNTKDIDSCLTPAVIRYKIIENRGHSCEVCGNSEWNGLPIHLEVHHVNGDSDDNSEVNLQILCPNCHAQTPNYGVKNKGRGRMSKRMTYLNEYRG